MRPRNPDKPPPPPEAFEIRPISEAELPALEWEGAYAHFRNLFRRSYEDAELGIRVMLVAVRAATQEVVGQVFVQFASSDPKFADGHSRGYLYALRVKPGFQERGLGRELIRAAEDLLRQRGMVAATLGVAKDNVRAQQLYQRLGYRIIADDPGRWSYVDQEGKVREVDEPSWLMEREL